MQKKCSIKRVVSGLVLACAFAVAGQSVAQAAANDAASWWQNWNVDLYVGNYQENPDGSINVQLVDSTSKPVSNWVWPANWGANTCAGKDWLTISGGHPARENLRKVLTAAGLSQTPIRVALDSAADNVCYLKAVRVVYRTP
jgi:hypothetical protein